MTPTDNPALYKALKEKRFTTTARVLGDEKAIGARVKIVNVAGQHVAWWQHQDKTIVLNDAHPHTDDPKTALIWERAKLFHELFHLLFTTHEKQREALYRASKDPQRYLWISNVLEDGRIEHWGGKMYAGTIWYIRCLLAKLVKKNSPDSGLLLYVRTRLWRNKKEAKYWSKYQSLIDEAIVAPTTETANTNAAKIVDDMFKPRPVKPPAPKVCRCPDCGAPMPAGAKVNVAPVDDDCPFFIGMAQCVCPTCGQASSGDGDGNGGGQGGEQGDDDTDTPDGDEDGDDDADTDTDGDGSGSNDDDGDGDFGSGSGQGGGNEDEENTDDPQMLPDPKAPTDEDIEKEIEKMVKDARERIDDEVMDELVELELEMQSHVQEQEYANPNEQQTARGLTEVFSGLLVESQRQRYVQCRLGGRLDTHRLLETQTGGDFMQEEVEKLSQPHIVLLVDESCSMVHLANDVSVAARVLNGALQSSGATSVWIGFGGKSGGMMGGRYVPSKIVPVSGFFCDGGHTPTGQALKAAHKWLDEEKAVRGMVIVLTDGQPSNAANAATEFHSLSSEGYFVLNVLLGGYVGDGTQYSMCHQWVTVKDPHTLVRLLEEPMGNFLSGTF